MIQVTLIDKNPARCAARDALMLAHGKDLFDRGAPCAILTYNIIRDPNGMAVLAPYVTGNAEDGSNDGWMCVADGLLYSDVLVETING